MARDVTSAPAILPAGETASRGRSRLGGVTQYAGFLPALVLFGVFFVAPLGLIVAYSFWQTVDYNVVHDWTVDNYRYFFSVPTYVSTFWAMYSACCMALMKRRKASLFLDFSTICSESMNPTVPSLG